MWRHLPASLYDTPAIETWLSDQARQGFRCVDFPTDVCVAFEKAEPADCQFCLEPGLHTASGPDGETRALYEAAGWEYVTVTFWKEFVLWRATRPDPRPIHTDPETEALAFGRVARALKGRLALWWGLLALVLGLWAATVWNGGGVIVPSIRYGNMTMAVNLFVVIWTTGMSVSDFRTLRAVGRRLRAGVPQSRPGAYGGRLRLWRVYSVMTPLLILLLTIPFWNTRQLDSPAELPVVTADVLGLEISPEQGFAAQSWTLLASRYLNVWQGNQAGNVRTEVFDLRPPLLSRLVLWELVAGSICQETGGDPARLADLRFDDLRYLADGSRQYLAARLGDRVLYVEAEVPQDLRDHLDQFAAALADG